MLVAITDPQVADVHQTKYGNGQSDNGQELFFGSVIWVILEKLLGFSHLKYKQNAKVVSLLSIRESRRSSFCIIQNHPRVLSRLRTIQDNETGSGSVFYFVSTYGTVWVCPGHVHTWCSIAALGQTLLLLK